MSDFKLSEPNFISTGALPQTPFAELTPAPSCILGGLFLRGGEKGVGMGALCGCTANTSSRHLFGLHVLVYMELAAGPIKT